MFRLENTIKLKKALIATSILAFTTIYASQQSYTVQKGDTLGIITKKLGIKSIKDVNFVVPSGDPSFIKPGETILYSLNSKVASNKQNSYDVNSWGGQKGLAADGGMLYPTKNGMYTVYRVNEQDTTSYNAGRDATPREIRAWNVDVMPDGTGLPEYDMKHGEIVKDENGNPKKAEGDVAWGGELYDQHCGMCHGDFGAGGRAYPKLAGGLHASLKNQRLNPAHANPNPDSPEKTIGTFWPYLSTLFWYTQDSMPYPYSKTLTNSETYAITAYLLMENGVKVDGEEIDDDFVLSKDNFLKIKLANENGFYPVVDTPENPKQGAENMRAFLGNPKNYGTGTRCMKDCIKEDVKDLMLRIDVDLVPNADQPLSVERSLPQKEENNSGSSHPGQALYDENGCAACHANSAIGAPVLGDKDAWKALLEKGIDKVYVNSINGINAMPPKGGTALSDDEFKLAVDYMIEASK